MDHGMLAGVDLGPCWVCDPLGRGNRPVLCRSQLAFLFGVLFSSFLVFYFLCPKLFLSAWVGEEYRARLLLGAFAGVRQVVGACFVEGFNCHVAVFRRRFHHFLRAGGPSVFVK